jgi:curved DNA-binding protein CbpA
MKFCCSCSLEYAYEPAEGFYEFVLGISQLPPHDNNECPYSVLGLPQGAPVSQVRSAYRTLAAKHHPDKHVATNVNNAELEFKRVTRAYDQIKRTGLAKDGTIASYSSLGGTARNGLSNPISINSTNMQDELPKGVQAAVRQLDSEIITRFLARSCARSGAAAVV